ncbi:MAG: benzoate-CoA ligase family protein [Actinomycetota bacterium]
MRTGTQEHTSTVAYNSMVDLLERNLVPGRAERPYLITEERTWSYEEVAAAADAAGSGLLGLGLSPGDRVILATRDRAEFVISFWGAIKAGLVAVPVAQGLSTSDLDFMLTDSEARVIVCDAASAGAVLPAAERTGAMCLLVDGEQRDAIRSWAEVCGVPASLDAAPTTGEDIALWLYTSGTTGLPKAVMHRHRHLEAAPGALSRQVIGMEAGDVVLSVSKMFFAYGLGNSVYLPAAAGASVVVNEAPVIPIHVQGLLNRTRPTLLFAVPAFYGGLMHLAEAELPSSLRMTISAGEALTADLFERFRDRFGLSLLDGLGATEALHHITSNRPDDVVAGSAGRALDGYEVTALDRDQQPVPEGESGELWVKGPTTFAGYWRRPELTSRSFLDGWMRTGDLVRVVDGRVFHEGRLDDLIKLGGVWVAPREIEEVLRAHEDVQDAAVVAVDDETGVPILRAFLLSDRRDDALRKEVLRLCRGRLATFKLPKSIEVVAELPRTPTGKLKRFVLRNGSRSAEPATS